MRLPTQIVISGYPYSVHEVSRDELTVGNLGERDPRQLRILISTEQNAYQARTTMLHEVLHGVLDVADLKDGKFDERWVSVISTLLLDTLRRNPDLVMYLMSDGGEG